MIRRGDYRAQFGQRLGWYSEDVRARLAQGPSRLWLQAVSVGEMFVAFKLIAAIREREPALPLILSTTTTTGFRLAKARAGENVEVVYTPIDLLPSVRRTFRILRPSAVVIVDGGLWPNQLWQARRRGVPAVLVNARLSPRSERRFRRFPRLSRAIFELLDLVCVPEESDLPRWTTLGARPENIRFTGSIKYDDSRPGTSGDGENGTVAPVASRPRSLLDSIGVTDTRPVLLAGSTHAGEESILAEAYLALRATCPELFLVIAPRHVERTAAIVEELQPFRLHLIRRTRLRNDPPAPVSGALDGPTDILLLDTTGELNDWYPLATVVFVGKSLTAIGGQNPAEAISAGVPVVVGPHMENFDDLTRSLLTAGAIIQLRDAADLRAACGRLLSDPAERAQMAAAALRQLEKHRGAAARSADLLFSLKKFSTC